MTLEALVFAVCIGGYSCDKMLEGYYLSRPELKLKVKEYKTYAEKVVGREIITVMPAIYALAGGYAYSIKITKNFTYNSRDDKHLIVWSKEF